MIKPKSTPEQLRQKLQTLKEVAHKIEVAEKLDLQQLMEQMVSTFPDQLYQTVDKGKRECPDTNRDFFISSVLWNDPFNHKIFKRQFFWSLECPRPYVNFTVFKYYRKTDEIELIWSIPDRETLNFYYNNRLHASPKDWDLLKYCIAYKDGTLYKRMKELNNETPDKPSLIVHDKTIFHANA